MLYMLRANAARSGHSSGLFMLLWPSSLIHPFLTLG